MGIKKHKKTHYFTPLNDILAHNSEQSTILRGCPLQVECPGPLLVSLGYVRPWVGENCHF